ncbi:MAG: hypothetical protein ACLSAF_21265 [Intestinimonas sp.]
MERRIRRAVLRSEGPEPVLTGRDLYDLGLRGGEIGRVRKALEAFVLAHPEANTRKALLDRADALKEGPEAAGMTGGLRPSLYISILLCPPGPQVWKRVAKSL